MTEKPPTDTAKIPASYSSRFCNHCLRLWSHSSNKKWYSKPKEHNEMTIHLPPHIEDSIQAAVHSGHFASVDDAMTEAASMLLQRLITA
jgi:hypothetical protein